MKSDYNDNFSQSIKDVLSALDLANNFSEMLDQRQAFIGGEWKDANSGWELKLEISQQAFSHQGIVTSFSSIIPILNHQVDFWGCQSLLWSFGRNRFWSKYYLIMIFSGTLIIFILRHPPGRLLMLSIHTLELWSALWPTVGLRRLRRRLARCSIWWTSTLLYLSLCWNDA